MPLRSRPLRASLIAPVIALWLGSADAQASTPEAQTTGAIAGLISDDTGAPIAEATITLATDGAERGVVGQTNEAGRFSLSNVPVGLFQLTVSAPGFVQQTVSGVAVPGQLSTLPPIRLTLAVTAVSVDVTPTRYELAEQQIKEQQQQRYAAAYATVMTRAAIVQILMPSVFKQEPRYFSNPITRPKIAGDHALCQNRTIDMGAGALEYVAQEFWFSKVTSRAHKSAGE